MQMHSHTYFVCPYVRACVRSFVTFDPRSVARVLVDLVGSVVFFLVHSFARSLARLLIHSIIQPS